jgi:plastocyanin
MLKPGSAGKRRWFAAGLIAAVALVGASLAFGSAPIIGQADNTFSAPTYTINQGEVATLQVTGSDHNATARNNGPDGMALFRSPTISGGQTQVNGTQYLTAGDYTFFCTVHPATMQATLHVTSAGAPVARPSATLSLQTKTISKALKKGLLVGINASSKVNDATITAKLGNATIGQLANASFTTGQQFNVVNLTKSGKSKLRKAKKAKITITASIPFGAPATARASLK